MVDFTVAIGSLKHETNTFSVVATSWEDFSPVTGDEVTGMFRGTRSEVGGFIDDLEKNDVNYFVTTVAGATPSGPLVRGDFDRIVESIIMGLEGRGDVDGILLALHGAMVARGVPEAEAHLLKAVRRKVGETVPIMITLDLHGLISVDMVNQVNGIFGFDTNPHIDMYERGIEASEALLATLKGRIKPVVAFSKQRMIPPTINQRTTEGPMVKLQDEARKMESREGVINVSIFPAFPYADVERVGSSVVVMTDDRPELAKELADSLGGMMWDLRDKFLKPLTPLEEAVDRAVEAQRGPIILADVADNPGGGAPGDGTVILGELIEKGAKNVGFAIIKDPEGVEKAIEVGVRGRLDTSIGGKTDDFHGAPLSIKGRVKTITDGRFIHKAMAVGTLADVGRTAVIDIDGVEVILTEKSHAPNDPEIFRRNGIEPTDKRVLVLKSRGHFRAAYESFAEEILEVDAPGLTSPNLSWFKYENIPRPIWPLDPI
jgi:microcystin degradation protein MlrC